MEWLRTCNMKAATANHSMPSILLLEDATQQHHAHKNCSRAKQAQGHRIRGHGGRAGCLCLYGVTQHPASRRLSRRTHPSELKSCGCDYRASSPGVERYVLLGAAYCLPQGLSVYRYSDRSGLASGDVPDAVFGELDRLRSEGDEVLLAGDFTCTVSILELPEAFTGVGHPRLTELRDNSDTGVNCFGRRFIEKSKETGLGHLAIVNGRTPGDSRPAAFTYSPSTAGRSSIDLCLASWFEHQKVLQSYLWGETNVPSDRHPIVVRLYAEWKTMVPSSGRRSSKLTNT
jgi:hypothetical protein